MELLFGEVFNQGLDLFRCSFFFCVDFPDVGTWNSVSFREVFEASFAGYDEFLFSRDIVKFLFGFLVQFV